MSDPRDRDEIVQRYTRRFQEFGVDVRALAAGTDARHRLKHSVHASIGDLEGATVLDVGCGLAHYYEHLLEDGVSVRYIGYDIVPAFLESDRVRHPEAEFVLRDVTVDGFGHEADYVVMCEVFNNRLQHASNMEVAQRVLREAFSIARRGVSIDFLSTYVDYQVPEAFYYSPEEMFTFAKSLTRLVALRHDYLPFHFTLLLRKEEPAG